MNRRTKIIVSVAGIFIVLLALLGLTYAYFLTRINGNSNDKSISVTTANLELTYEDGNGAILGNNIMPGTTLTTKEFSVRNDGEDTEYLVVLENVEVLDSSNNTTTFESNDFTYTLTCTSNCNGVTNEVLPLSDGILVSNSIKKGVTQNYTLTITYNETGTDQSIDMGETLSAKVSISTIEKFNPYNSDKSLLAYNIINNSILNKNGTEFRLTPLTEPAKEISLENEKELSIAADDYGTSYYYRGSVEDNYLELNNMCFRIVRIEGDGAIKLTLAKEDKCSTINESDIQSAMINNNETVIFGYKTKNSANYSEYTEYEGGLYSKLNEWYNSKLLPVQKHLKNEIWCLGGNDKKYDFNTGELLDDTIIDSKIASGETLEVLYETGKRLMVDKNTTFKCSSDARTVNEYFGGLQADEIAYAGGIVGSRNSYYYLNKNAEMDYWLLSYFYFYLDKNDDYFNGDSPGIVVESYIDWGCTTCNSAVRPAVTLKSGVKLSSGDGTIGNPYIIE